MKKFLLLLAVALLVLGMAAVAEGTNVQGRFEEGSYIVEIPVQEGDEGWKALVEESETPCVALSEAETADGVFTAVFEPLSDGPATIRAQHYEGVACDQAHTWELLVSDGAITEVTGGSYTASPDEASQDPFLSGTWQEIAEARADMTIVKSPEKGWVVDLNCTTPGGQYIFQGSMFYDCALDAFVYGDGAFYEAPATDQEQSLGLGAEIAADTTGCFALAVDEEGNILLNWFRGQGPEAYLQFTRIAAAPTPAPAEETEVPAEEGPQATEAPQATDEPEPTEAPADEETGEDQPEEEPGEEPGEEPEVDEESSVEEETPAEEPEVPETLEAPEETATEETTTEETTTEETTTEETTTEETGEEPLPEEEAPVDEAGEAEPEEEEEPEDEPAVDVSDWSYYTFEGSNVAMLIPADFESVTDEPEPGIFYHCGDSELILQVTPIEGDFADEAALAAWFEDQEEIVWVEQVTINGMDMVYVEAADDNICAYATVSPEGTTYCFTFYPLLVDGDQSKGLAKAEAMAASIIPSEDVQ